MKVNVPLLRANTYPWRVEREPDVRVERIKVVRRSLEMDLRNVSGTRLFYLVWKVRDSSHGEDSIQEAEQIIKW